MVLNALRRSDEIRPPSGVAPSSVLVDEGELAAALDLIGARSVDTLAEIPDLTDHYAQALAAMVDAKLHARDLARPAQSARGPHPVDLMDMLQQSVRDAHADRGDAWTGWRSSRRSFLPDCRPGQSLAEVQDFLGGV